MKSRSRRLTTKGLVLASMLFLTLTLSLATAGGGTELPVTISTMPLEEVWLADGTSVYRMDVVLDATQLNEEIISTTWRLDVPEYLTFLDAEFPVEGFFFEGYDLDEPFSDPAYQTDTNSYGVVVSIVGSAGLINIPGVPSGEGILGTYWFTANTNAPAGETSFDISYFNAGYFNYEFPIETCPSGDLEVVCEGWAETYDNQLFMIEKPVEKPACSGLLKLFTGAQCGCSSEALGDGSC